MVTGFKIKLMVTIFVEVLLDSGYLSGGEEL